MIDPADLTGTSLAEILAALAAGNPARRVATLPPACPAGRVATAALVAAVPLLALGWASEAVLDALAISAPTARLAAGLVLVVVGLVDLVRAARALDIADPGILVPLAFPLLLRPELALVVLVAGADRGVAGGTAATIVPLAATLFLAVVTAPGGASGGVGGRTGRDVVVVAGARVRGPGPAGIDGLGRVLAALGVLVGVGLVLDGIFAL